MIWLKKYNWACIGCGDIASDMAKVMVQRGKSFCGVYSRTAKRAEAFADKYGIEKVYSSADELFADESIDVVYIATPHNCHIEYILKAAKSKKHILCEKAITVSFDELEKAVEAAKENGVILAEAQTIYHMPVFDEVFSHVKNGSLGKLKMLDVNFGTKKEYDITNRFFSPELAGGAMLDIGVYALSFVRLFLSENASEIKSIATLAPTGVDDNAIILLSNSKNEMANVKLSFSAKLPRTAIASFEKGYVEFDNFNRATRANIIFNDGRAPIEIRCSEDIYPLHYEVEDMETALSGGENKMKLDLTLDVMEIMTKLRNEWGAK
jgi:predicted dehydrogenase